MTSLSHKDPMPERPNIIFILADDWGYGDLGIHSSTFCDTPQLDAMAAEGTDVQNFWVNNPVCSPSRSAIMTGHFPARHRIHGHFSTVEAHIKRDMPDWLDPQLPMLPRILKNAGYKTAHFGKWHLTNTKVPDAPMLTAYGYDEYGAFNHAGEQMPVEETCSRTIDFIQRNQEHPFFVNVWIHETHTPHYPKEKYLGQFPDQGEKEQVYAALANTPLPDDYRPDGEDVSAALFGQNFVREKALYWEWRKSSEDREWWPHYGVQNDQWRFVMNESGSRLELYDMKSDWAERHNLAASHPDAVSKLQSLIREWSATLPKGPAETGLSATRKDW